MPALSSILLNHKEIVDTMKFFAWLSVLLLFTACQLKPKISDAAQVPETAVSPTATLTPTASALTHVTAMPTPVAPTATPTAKATPVATATRFTLPTYTPSPTPLPAPFTLGPAQILGRGQMIDADFTADGYTLVIAWAAGLSLLESTTAQEIWWQPLAVLPLALDIQPEGEAIAVALGDGTAIVVQTADRSQQSYPITDHVVDQADIAWSPDNSQLAAQYTGPSYDSLIQRVDIATGQVTQIPTSRHPQARPYLVWSPDGQMISVADMDKDCTQLVDVDSGETRFSLALDNDCYASHALAWSPDGRLLALGNPAGTIDLVDSATHTVVQDMAGGVPFSPLWSQSGPPLFFNADGTLLVNLGGLDYFGDHPPTVWRTATGEVVAEGENHPFLPLASAFVDERLVSLYQEGTVTDWDFAAQAAAEEIGQLPMTAVSWPPFAWSENGRYLATGNQQSGLIVWDVASAEIRLNLDKEVAATAFSPDEQWLAVVDWRQSALELYDLNTGQISRTWAGATAVMQGVAFAPDGRSLAYGVGDTVVMADVETGMETAVLTGYPPGHIITQIRWAPDGTALIAGSDLYYSPDEGEVEVPGLNILWERTAEQAWTEAFRAENVYNDSFPEVVTALFNPAGSLVAFESLLNPHTTLYKILVYDRQQDTVILTLEDYRLNGWQSDTLLLTFSGLGDMLLTQWDVSTGQKVISTARAANSNAHSPDKSFFAQPRPNYRGIEIREWLSDQVREQRGSGHDLGLTIWSPDGRFIAAAASDGTITIWPIQWT